MLIKEICRVEKSHNEMRIFRNNNMHNLYMNDICIFQSHIPLGKPCWMCCVFRHCKQQWIKR